MGHVPWPSVSSSPCKVLAGSKSMCEDLTEKHVSTALIRFHGPPLSFRLCDLGRSLNLSEPLFPLLPNGRNDSAQIKCNEACKGLGTR